VSRSHTEREALGGMDANKLQTRVLFYELLLRDILSVGRRCNFSFKFLVFKFCLVSYWRRELFTCTYQACRWVGGELLTCLLSMMSH